MIESTSWFEDWSLLFTTLIETNIQSRYTIYNTLELEVS